MKISEFEERLDKLNQMRAARDKRYSARILQIRQKTPVKLAPQEELIANKLVVSQIIDSPKQTFTRIAILFLKLIANIQFRTIRRQTDFAFKAIRQKHVRRQRLVRTANILERAVKRTGLSKIIKVHVARGYQVACSARFALAQVLVCKFRTRISWGFLQVVKNKASQTKVKCKPSPRVIVIALKSLIKNRSFYSFSKLKEACRLNTLHTKIASSTNKAVSANLIISALKGPALKLKAYSFRRLSRSIHKSSSQILSIILTICQFHQRRILQTWRVLQNLKAHSLDSVNQRSELKKSERLKLQVTGVNGELKYELNILKAEQRDRSSTKSVSSSRMSTSPGRSANRRAIKVYSRLQRFVLALNVRYKSRIDAAFSQLVLQFKSRISYNLKVFLTALGSALCRQPFRRLNPLHKPRLLGAGFQALLQQRPKQR